MNLGWPLIFLRQGQICIPKHLYWENVKKSFSQNVWKTYGWNLQCVIKVVKRFSYNKKKIVPWGYVLLSLLKHENLTTSKKYCVKEEKEQFLLFSTIFSMYH